MDWMDFGLTRPEGREPALCASTRPWPWMRAKASAIWLRLEFSTQTNRTCFIRHGGKASQPPVWRTAFVYFLSSAFPESGSGTCAARLLGRDYEWTWHRQAGVVQAIFA